jgi:hypothetical protein
MIYEISVVETTRLTYLIKAKSEEQALDLLLKDEDPDTVKQLGWEIENITELPEEEYDYEN